MIGYLNRKQSQSVLDTNCFGHIGCNDGFNTYIYPTSYVFDGIHILCKSLPGAKIAIMRVNKRLCFQVDEIIDSMNWKSVMAMGDYEELEDSRERYYAIKAFAAHSLRLKVSETALPPAGANQHAPGNPAHEKQPIIYRIRLVEIYGRFENGEWGVGRQQPPNI